MPLTLLVIALPVVVWVWLRNQPASQRKPAMIKLALMAAIGIVVLMAVTGRLHALFALLAFLYPLLRRVLPSLLTGRMAGAGTGDANASSGNQSHVSGDILEMSESWRTWAKVNFLSCCDTAGRTTRTPPGCWKAILTAGSVTHGVLTMRPALEAKNPKNKPMLAVHLPRAKHWTSWG